MTDVDPAALKRIALVAKEHARSCREFEQEVTADILERAVDALLAAAERAKVLEREAENAKADIAQHVVVGAELCERIKVLEAVIYFHIDPMDVMEQCQETVNEIMDRLNKTMETTRPKP